MKTWIKNLFSESSEVSMMRVLCFMSMSTAIILAFMDKNADVLLFVSAAITGKVGQKIIETKS